MSDFPSCSSSQLLISISSLFMEPKPITTCFSTIFHFTSLLLLLLFLSMLFVPGFPSTLSFDFYAGSCPNVELLVKNTVRSAIAFDQTLPGKLLRLLFHDCMVEGCDGSVLVEGKGTERDDPANASLGGFGVVDSAKSLLELLCPGTVSCADILVLAARDAVEATGGPSVQVETGRRDGTVSSASNVRANMVDTTFSLDQMIQLFSSKGLSMPDLVTLSGAHTIGAAHCGAFSDRFNVDSRGEMTLADASLDKKYATELMKQCPANASPSVTVNNDPQTAFLFDNQYFKNLLSGKGLFQSDSVLVRDARTKGNVESFSNNEDSFFQSWGTSFVKLTSISVKTGNQGEIRRNCRFNN